MLFDDLKLKSAGLSETKIAALKRRQRGGQAGNAGYVYQRRYALLRLAELAVTAPEAVVAMEALCPVDDVVIEHTAGHEHAQCKISPTQSWAGDNNKLMREFKAQHTLLKKCGASQHRLVLVVAHERLGATLQVQVPRTLRAVVDVVVVEQSSPEHHPWKAARTIAALDALLPPALRTLGNREGLHKELNHFAFEPWQRTSAGSVLSAIAAETPFPIVLTGANRRIWSVVPAMWQSVTDVLCLIQGLTIDVTGDVCCYRFGVESGLVARCDTPLFKRFCKDVVAKLPGTMDAFYEVLPR
jgi:hypothetical protein